MTRYGFFFLLLMNVCRIGAVAPEIIFSGETDEVLTAYQQWGKKVSSPVLPSLARTIVTDLLHCGKPESTVDIPWILRPVGLFVTVMRGSKVRACVGTFYPKSNTLSEELLVQCRRLTVADPRHPPLDSLELNELSWVVTLTGNLQPVVDPLTVDIQLYGLSAEWEGREVILLPGEAKTLKWGLSYLHRQLQIPKGQLPRYFSFPVLVWKVKPGDRQHDGG